MQERQYSTILDATAFSLGSGIGWFIAIVAIAAIREKLRYSNVPGPLRIGNNFYCNWFNGDCLHELYGN